MSYYIVTDQGGQIRVNTWEELLAEVETRMEMLGAEGFQLRDDYESIDGLMDHMNSYDIDEQYIEEVA